MSGIAQGFGADKQGHIFLVVEVDADPPPSGNDTGLWKMTNADNTHFPFTDGNVYDSILKSSRDNFGNPTPALTSWRVYQASIIASLGSGQANGTYLVGIDSSNSLINQNGTAIVQVQYIAAPTLGRNGASQGFKGKMAGLYLFTQTLSSGDRTDMITYINTRFGLSSS